jgi:hypothetical protein
LFFKIMKNRFEYLPQNRNLRFSNAQPEGRTNPGSATVPKSIVCAKEKAGTDAKGKGLEQDPFDSGQGQTA